MFYCGIDPHKQFHMAVLINEAGQEIARKAFPARPTGYRQLLAWTRKRAPDCLIGCENPQSYARGLTQYLVRQGLDVRSVHALLTGQYRRRSQARPKSDPHDALAVARSLLQEQELLPRVLPEGPIDDLQVLVEHYDNLTQEKTRLLNRLHSHLFELDPDYKQQGSLKELKTLQYWASQAQTKSHQVRWQVVASLTPRAQDILHELKALEHQLTAILKDVGAEPLLEIPGIGTYLASKLLAETGNPVLFRSEAAWASYAGVAPLECSSGGRKRYRVNPGGNRQLNYVLHHIALSQIAHVPEARAYLQKQEQAGHTHREALRALKRQVARRVFKAMKLLPLFQAKTSGQAV